MFHCDEFDLPSLRAINVLTAFISVESLVIEGIHSFIL